MSVLRVDRVLWKGTIKSQLLGTVKEEVRLTAALQDQVHTYQYICSYLCSHSEF